MDPTIRRSILAITAAVATIIAFAGLIGLATTLCESPPPVTESEP